VNLTIPDGVVTNWRENAAQRVGIAHLLLAKRMVLADPTGTGKTPQAVIAWAILHHRLGWPVLVLTSKSNLRPWMEKAQLFAPATRAAIYHGKSRHKALTPGINHVVSTPSTVAKDPEPILKHFGGSPKVVIIDEAHRLRNWGRNAKAVDKETGAVTRKRVGTRRDFYEELTRDAEYLMALTATPAAGRLEEVAGLLDLVVPGLFGGLRPFRDDFTKPHLLVKPKNGGRWVYRTPRRLTDYKNIGVLLDRMDPYLLVRPFEAFGEVLPSVDHRVIDLEMEPDHRKLYEQVLDGLLPATPDRDERIVADIAKHTLCQRVVDAPDVMGYKTHRLPVKAKELVRLLKEELANDHVLIYSRYADVVRWLAGVLKKEKLNVVGMITGAETEQARTRARDRFKHQAGPPPPSMSGAKGVAWAQKLREGETGNGCQLLITGAGAEALDLQEARAVVFYDLPWGPDELTQTVGRARRLGSKHENILVFILNCLSTVDQRTLQLLITKKTITSLLDPQTYTSTTPTVATATATPTDTSAEDARGHHGRRDGGNHALNPSAESSISLGKSKNAPVATATATPTDTSPPKGGGSFDLDLSLSLDLDLSGRGAGETTDGHTPVGESQIPGAAARLNLFTHRGKL
jgi:SNF2 family DNA or RNA helicase